ncbi:MAG: hypothetical protein GXO47_14595, partial [Chlorobi bacterium]|nr:hypothetical protein [Chlorobiota bacterium]
MRYAGITLLILIFQVSVFSQSNKKARLNKRTSKREIRKRQEEARKKNKDSNAFNPLQPMGSKENTDRDDIFWGSETANTVYVGAGNVSLISPSRYGIKQDVEISTVLGYDYWIPNIFIKKRWKDDKIKIASRHGLYSATPGMNWAQNNGHYEYIDSLADIPVVLSVRNEVFFSYAFYHDVGCIQKQPFIIVTLNLGADGGIPLNKGNIDELNKHFLTNRSPALLGQGIFAYTKARLDAKLYDYLYIGTSMNFYFGQFTGNFSFENHTAIQTFITKSLSASAGFYL